jgi:CBS domain-containing protein
VIDEGALVGIITTTDLLRALLDLARLHGKEA